MKQAILLAAVVLFASASLPGQTNRIASGGDRLWFMYYDSSKSKSTIVEFDDFLAMIEVPVKDEGGSARVLEEHRGGGERALRSLREAFPGKPLKYLLHSHWHPHSISSVSPFLEAGATLVTTRKNFDRLRAFVDSSTASAYRDRITFVDGDSLLIEAPGNRIVAYRFTREDYPSVPTDDYLFAYLPDHNFLHCACMYNKWTGDPVEGKELLTGREQDIYRFLGAKGLKPRLLIRLANEKDEGNDFQSYDGLVDVVENGISESFLTDRFLSADASTLLTSRDSVLRSVVEGNIPPSVINRAVYRAAGSGDLQKAIQLAHLQAMAAPSSPNVWDTLGEMYYETGDTLMARSFGQQAKRISPSFEGGGEDAWKKSIGERRKKGVK